MPSGRGRRSAAAVAAAASALQSSTPSSSAAASAAPVSDFYNTLANLSAMTGSGGSAAADLMRFSSMPYGLGLGSLGLGNPMYAASLAGLGILPGMLPPVPGFDGAEGDKDAKGSGSKKQEHSASSDSEPPTSSLHPSFPYLYNPLIYSQLYAQSLAAATASNFGLPGPFGSLGLGLDAPAEHSVVEESKSDLKTHKSHKAPSSSASSSAAIKEAYRPVHTNAEAVSHHVTADQPSAASSYSLEALTGAASDQSEPEDLSVLSKKRRDASDITLSSESAEIDSVCPRHNDIEDLSRKPSVPAVILSVPESRNLVSGTSSSTRVPPSTEKQLATKSLADSHVATDAGKTPQGSRSGRLQSRLIDSIGSKLMAQKQKCSDDSETLSSSETEPPSTQLCASSSKTASDDHEQTQSSAAVSLIAEKSSSETAETDNIEQQAPL